MCAGIDDRERGSVGEGRGRVSRRAAENVAMSPARKALAGSYGATDPASEVVGLAVPISVDIVLPVQSGCDVARIGAGPAGVEGS